MPVFPSNNNILDLGSLSIEGEVRRPVLPYSTSQKKIFSVAGYLINDEFEFKIEKIKFNINSIESKLNEVRDSLKNKIISQVSFKKVSQCDD